MRVNMAGGIMQAISVKTNQLSARTTQKGYLLKQKPKNDDHFNMHQYSQYWRMAD